MLMQPIAVTTRSRLRACSATGKVVLASYLNGKRGAVNCCPMRLLSDAIYPRFSRRYSGHFLLSRSNTFCHAATS